VSVLRATVASLLMSDTCARRTGCGVSSSLRSVPDTTAPPPAAAVAAGGGVATRSRTCCAESAPAAIHALAATKPAAAIWRIRRVIATPP
jgi:hypothetical protein